jgi:hypothetical protein
MLPRNFDVNKVKIVKLQHTQLQHAQLQHAQSAQWKLALKLALKDGHFEGVCWIELAKDRMQLRGP